MDSSTQPCMPSALLLSAIIAFQLQPMIFPKVTFLSSCFFSAVVKETDSLPTTAIIVRLPALLLYWQYFKNVCCIIVWQQAVLRTLHLSFSLQQTNKKDMTGKWRNAFTCVLSLHNVYLEMTCCSRDQTCLFHCIISLSISASQIIWLWLLLLFVFQGNLQLFSHPQVIKYSLWVGRPSFFCVYLSCFSWVEKCTKTSFDSLLF